MGSILCVHFEFTIVACNITNIIDSWLEIWMSGYLWGKMLVQFTITCKPCTFGEFPAHSCAPTSPHSRGGLLGLCWAERSPEQPWAAPLC